MTLHELYQQTRRSIAAKEPEFATQAARELVAFATGKTVELVLRDGNESVSAANIRTLERVLKEYLWGKPLAYILGQWSFFGIPLKITQDVLIPRDDTMVVTALALEAMLDMDAPRVLDLCTGSGCIGIAVAKNAPHSRVTLTDISEAALSVARENVNANRLQKQINLMQVDVTKPAPKFLGLYDVIVSNPPYITAEDMTKLDVSVRDYEPGLALYGGEDGLNFYRSICRNFCGCLKEGGALCLEFGRGQEHAVETILKEYNFSQLLFCRDTAGIVRAVMARKERKDK